MMEEKTPLSHEVVCFQMPDFGASTSNSKPRTQIKNNILVENSRKLRYFRGSRFSQFCIPSTALHCLFTKSVFGLWYRSIILIINVDVKKKNNNILKISFFRYRRKSGAKFTQGTSWNINLRSRNSGGNCYSHMTSKCVSQKCFMLSKAAVGF